MPRSGKYKPWSSKNIVAILNHLKAVRVPIFRNSSRTNRQGVKVDIKETIVGRRHHEEAFLIQERGMESETPCMKCAKGFGIFSNGCVSVASVHRGACANCVFQSGTLSCTHIITKLEEENAAQAMFNEAKKAKRKLDEVDHVSTKPGSEKKCR